MASGEPRLSVGAASDHIRHNDTLTNRDGTRDREQGLAGHALRSRGVLIALDAVVILVAYSPVILGVIPINHDTALYQVPHLTYLVDSLRAGYFPLVNMYADFGGPLFADPQSGLWYPLNWVVGYLLDFGPAGIRTSIVVHALIAYLGCVYLARQLRVDRLTGRIAGALYIASQPYFFLIAHHYWQIALAWMPFVLALGIRFVLRRDYLSACAAAVLMALVVLSGAAMMAWYLVLFVTPVVLLVWVTERRGLNRAIALRLLASLVVGVALLYPMLIGASMTAEAGVARAGAVETGTRLGYAEAAGTQNTSITTMLTMLYPGLTFWWTETPGLFVGWIPFLLLAASVHRYFAAPGNAVDTLATLSGRFAVLAVIWAAVLALIAFGVRIPGTAFVFTVLPPMQHVRWWHHLAIFLPFALAWAAAIAYSRRPIALEGVRAYWGGFVLIGVLCALLAPVQTGALPIELLEDLFWGSLTVVLFGALACSGRSMHPATRHAIQGWGVIAIVLFAFSTSLARYANYLGVYPHQLAYYSGHHMPHESLANRVRGFPEPLAGPAFESDSNAWAFEKRSYYAYTPYKLVPLLANRELFEENTRPGTRLVWSDTLNIEVGSILMQGPNRFTLQARTEDPDAALELRLIALPGYHVTVNGMPRPWDKTATGLLAIPLDRGDNLLAVRFELPFLRLYLAILSIATVVVSVVLGTAVWRTCYGSTSRPAE